MVITKKCNPTRSVVKQLPAMGKYQPVLIHQHSGRISKIPSGHTTVRPVSNNYARATIKL